MFNVNYIQVPINRAVSSYSFSDSSFFLVGWSGFYRLVPVVQETSFGSFDGYETGAISGYGPLRVGVGATLTGFFSSTGGSGLYPEAVSGYGGYLIFSGYYGYVPYVSESFNNYLTGVYSPRLYFSGSGFFAGSGYTIPSGSGI